VETVTALNSIQRLAALGLVQLNDDDAEDRGDNDVVELLVDGLLSLAGAARVRKVSLGVLGQVVYESTTDGSPKSIAVADPLSELEIREITQATAPVLARDRDGIATSLLVPLPSRSGMVEVFVVERTLISTPVPEYELLIARTLRDQAAVALALRDARARARLDPLTSCLNHGAMHSQLEKEIARVQRRTSSLSCVMIDIDDFKAINDERGHAVGDHVVHHVGKALLDECRRYDSCARYGGDEFLVMLPDTGIVDAVRAAERMRAAVSQWAGADPRVDFAVTITAGVADWRSGQNAAELLEQADRALMAGKAAGKDRVGVY
jgi:diguanylate cyclase (GGDEF)-like protein